MSTTETLTANQALTGFVKIWQVDPSTGDTLLIVDKPNMILTAGTKIIAKTLGGDNNYKIWGMYIGYNNSASFTPPAIVQSYSSPFSGFTSPFGYLREPLTFDPSYMSTTGYDSNTVLFSTMITTASKQGGADFTHNVSNIYEVALVAAPTGVVGGDVVFSRTNFTPIRYDSTYNFTITWGVRILLP